MVEKANEVTVKQKLGFVSNETLATELGYDYADEQSRLDNEHATAPTPPPSTLDLAPQDGEDRQSPQE